MTSPPASRWPDLPLRRLLRLLLIVGLLASCTSPERPRPGAPSDPESPVVSAPGQNPSTPGEGPLFVKPRPGLVDVRPHQFERARATGLRTVVVRFYGGVEACEGLDRVEVEYEEKQIVVTLFVGRVPTAEVCIEVAVLKATRVQLEQPVADRRIVDGAPRR
jgi:hypothetical protein